MPVLDPRAGGAPCGTGDVDALVVGAIAVIGTMVAMGCCCPAITATAGAGAALTPKKSSAEGADDADDGAAKGSPPKKSSTATAAAGVSDGTVAGRGDGAGLGAAAKGSLPKKSSVVAAAVGAGDEAAELLNASSNDGLNSPSPESCSGAAPARPA